MRFEVITPPVYISFGHSANRTVFAYVSIGLWGTNIMLACVLEKYTVLSSIFPSSELK
jgi:hypothetical protein